MKCLLPTSNCKPVVRQALDWDLEGDARDIAVTTETGAVTLSGYVPSFFTKAHAVKTAGSVFWRQRNCWTSSKFVVNGHR